MGISCTKFAVNESTSTPEIIDNTTANVNTDVNNTDFNETNSAIGVTHNETNPTQTQTQSLIEKLTVNTISDANANSDGLISDILDIGVDIMDIVNAIKTSGENGVANTVKTVFDETACIIDHTTDIIKNFKIQKSKYAGHFYNLKIDRINPVKFKLLKLNKLTGPLPDVVDLRSKFPPVYNQGELGSCTANALCALMGYNIPTLAGSRLFLYYNERKMENNIPDDSGATLTSGIRSLQYNGLCQESDWVYDINKFAVQPPDICYTNALKYKALLVRNIPNDINVMKHALAENIPFVAGIAIFESFENENVNLTGNVPMPDVNNEQFCGGHAILICGFKNAEQVWICRNSWGPDWGGNQGYFYLPYAYLLDSSLATDLWTINSGFNYHYILLKRRKN